MKALGIVRRIDDLGRVVIPSEIRKRQNWKTGEPMEMFMAGNKLVIQPYKDDLEKKELLFQLKSATNTKEYVTALNSAISYLESK